MKNFSKNSKLDKLHNTEIDSYDSTLIQSNYLNHL